MPLMPVKINSPASINFAIPIVSALVFSMHNGKLVGPVDGFSTADWDYIRTIATKRAIAIRSQGFIHPATLVPSELEYAEGYRARMSVLWNKMRPLSGTKNHYAQRPASQPKLTTIEPPKSEANVGATKVKKIRKPRKTKTSETGKPK